MRSSGPLYPLDEYAGETASTRKERYERYVTFIKREVSKGQRLKAFEVLAYVLTSRDVGALHDEQAIPLVDLILKQLKGEEDAPTNQISLF